MDMDTKDLNIADRIDQILANWGADDKDLPNKEAWQAVKDISPDQRITLVNFFKMRDRAAYPASFSGDVTDISGKEAFQRYAQVSMPSLERVGGHFLMVAPFGKRFIGGEQDWDLVAVGSYPNSGALLALFELEAYRKAYVHRIAACARQQVSLCIGG